MAGRDWRKDNLVSLAGVYLPKERIEDSTTPAALVKYLNEKPQIKKIFLNFDNDNAGRKASLALKTIVHTAIRAFGYFAFVAVCFRIRADQYRTIFIGTAHT